MSYPKPKDSKDKDIKKQELKAKLSEKFANKYLTNPTPQYQ